MPYNVSQVEADLAAQAEAAPSKWQASGLNKAESRVWFGKHIARLGERVVRSLGSGALGAAEAVAAPAGLLGHGILRGTEGTMAFLARHPAIGRRVAAVTMAAPIILSQGGSYADQSTDAILRSYHDPQRLVAERDVMASLDTFLEKKAFFDRKPGLGAELGGGIVKGLGEELGKALIFGAGRLFGGLRDTMANTPAKKNLLDQLIKTDQVLSDAVRRSPAMSEQLLQAYSTLNKFAPTLAADVNAVRSFLREVVLGGGHVNYATIKNLVETEKSIHGNEPMYKGIL